MDANQVRDTLKNAIDNIIDAAVLKVKDDIFSKLKGIITPVTITVIKEKPKKKKRK